MGAAFLVYIIIIKITDYNVHVCSINLYLVCIHGWSSYQSYYSSYKHEPGSGNNRVHQVENSATRDTESHCFSNLEPFFQYTSVRTRYAFYSNAYQSIITVKTSFVFVCCTARPVFVKKQGGTTYIVSVLKLVHHLSLSIWFVSAISFKSNQSALDYYRKGSSFWII